MSKVTPGENNEGQLEERVDLSDETEEKISQAQSLINDSTSNLPEALALMTALEKQCRVRNDTPSLIRVCETSLQICKDCADEETLITTIKNIANRRNQKSRALSAIVQKAIPWVLKNEGTRYIPIDVENMNQKETKKKMVITLRDITSGNIFLEYERAKLTRVLAIIKENDGDITGASDVLQEVNVETFGSLSKREKVDFILEQIRLSIRKKDYVRAAIVSNKINCKSIAEEGMEEEKIKYYTLMTEYHRYRKDAYELARDYHEIYCTSTVQKEKEQWREALKSTVLFLALSPYSIDQQKMINFLSLDPNVAKVDSCRDLIKLITKKEIVRNSVAYHGDFMTLDAITKGGKELTEHWLKIFHARIIQHNIRVVALYYRRIHGKRLGQLLKMEPEDLEPVIANMISNGEVYAKIDRPRDIINFSQSRNSDAILSNWVSDISSLLCLVEKTTHLIKKEHMTQ